MSHTFGILMANDMIWDAKLNYMKKQSTLVAFLLILGPIGQLPSTCCSLKIAATTEHHLDRKQWGNSSKTATEQQQPYEQTTASSSSNLGWNSALAQALYQQNPAYWNCPRETRDKHPRKVLNIPRNNPQRIGKWMLIKQLHWARSTTDIQATNLAIVPKAEPAKFKTQAGTMQDCWTKHRDIAYLSC